MTKKNTFDGIPLDKPSNRRYLNIHINLGETYCKSVHWVQLTQNRTKWGGVAITKVINYLSKLKQYFNDSKKCLYHRVSSAAWSVQHKNTWGNAACVESQGFQVILQTENLKEETFTKN